MLTVHSSRRQASQEQIGCRRESGNCCIRTFINSDTFGAAAPTSSESCARCYNNQSGEEPIVIYSSFTNGLMDIVHNSGRRRVPHPGYDRHIDSPIAAFTRRIHPLMNCYSRSLVALNSIDLVSFWCEVLCQSAYNHGIRKEAQRHIKRLSEV